MADVETVENHAGAGDAAGAGTPAETVVAGVTIRSRHHGEGPPIVVLHHSFGNPGLAFQQALATDHHVAVPDLPGFGESERPDWARHPRDLALLIGHWLRKRGLDGVTLVGCGFGGWVAAELATMRADHIGSLVLVGAAGLLPREGRILDQVLVSHGEYVKAAFHEPVAYEALYGGEFTDEVLLQWDLNREMVARVSWKPYMYSRQMSPLLAEVDVPTLLVWGDHDAVVPLDCAEQYRAALPDARLEVVGGCGHAVDLEQPETLARLVREHVRR
jgi:pimeloyl-ACP methyl ester carboxylesterase